MSSRQESDGGCGAESGRGTAARILQENSGAGQRLCLKGATWVGTAIAPNDNEVPAGHQGHTGHASRTQGCYLVIHLQTVLLWVRLRVLELKEPHSTLPTRGLGHAEQLRRRLSCSESELTFAEFHGPCPTLLPRVKRERAAAVSPSQNKGTALGAPPRPVRPIPASTRAEHPQMQLLICGRG